MGTQYYYTTHAECVYAKNRAITIHMTAQQKQAIN